MSAGLGRRCAALAYDALIVAALWLLFTAGALLLTHGHAILYDQFGAWAYVYRCALVSLAFAYYALCVCRTGRTLGMRAWHLRAQRLTGELMSFSRALARAALGSLAWAAGGLGVLWLYVDREGLALHDRLTGTRVVRI